MGITSTSAGINSWTNQVTAAFLCFTEKQELKRKIDDLTRSSSGSRLLSEASTNLSQAKHEIRTLKQTLEQKDRTIDQLKANAKALASKQTPGSAGASQHVDSLDPLSWPAVLRDKVFSWLNTVRLTNPVRPVNFPNYGDFSAMPAELPVWTPEGFVCCPVGHTCLHVAKFRDVSVRSANMWTIDTVREVEVNLPRP